MLPLPLLLPLPLPLLLPHGRRTRKLWSEVLAEAVVIIGPMAAVVTAYPVAVGLRHEWKAATAPRQIDVISRWRTATASTTIGSW